VKVVSERHGASIFSLLDILPKPYYTMISIAEKHWKFKAENKTLPTIRAVIFDFIGTLVNVKGYSLENSK